MKITLYLFLAIILVANGYGVGILVLDGNNFDQVLSQVDNVMVEFYIPGCTKCHQFSFEYAKASHFLNRYSSKIKFFEVDASTERTIVERYQITKFPTTVLFIKGSKTPLEYTGAAKAEEIAEWVLSKTFGSPRIQENKN